jgi:N-sulfoglucosamine sulfohydrolase
MSNKLISYVSLSALIALPVFHAEGKTPQKPANVLLILADDCSYYDIGCFGSKNTKTPNIDKIAQDGIKFNSAYNSSSMSTPTRHSLYTGLFPMKHGGYANHSRVHDHVKSMPHYLEKLGYRVGIAGKLHIKPLENFPFEMVPGFIESCVVLDPSYTTDGIEEFMSRDKDKPFCLVLASINPHMPSTGGDASVFDRSKLVLPPYFVDTQETRERYARYLAEVHLLDQEVGDAVNVLKKHGLYENTLVIFMSEQGSQFAGAKWTNWSAGVKSAMVASWPQVIKPGVESKAIVQYEDVLPTIIDLAGGKKEKVLDGISFSCFGNWDTQIKSQIILRDFFAPH